MRMFALRQADEFLWFFRRNCKFQHKSLLSNRSNMKQIFNVASHYQRVKNLYLRYERLLMPATLVVGFLVDYFTFTSINISITFGLLLIYWVIAGATIFFINFYDAGKLSLKFKYARLFAPLAIQFTFGALLGSSLVFYWVSGALSVSWPIMLLVALLMVFNDVFRHYFLKPAVQISVYFFITLSLFSLILPFLFTSLSPWLFVLAGALSLVIFYFFIKFFPLAGENLQQRKRYLFVLIFAILLMMNVLYFTDIIPPIPLALREAGLYHNIQVSNGKYNMQGEAENFWQAIIPGQILHVVPGQKVYFYTAIFAPVALQTDIVHHWQRYDETKKEWLDAGKLSFKIIGGRKEGYKGYSYQSDLVLGQWRIFVKNQRGQVLGRIRFSVEGVEIPVELREVIR